MKLFEISKKFTEESESLHAETLHHDNASLHYEVFCTVKYGPTIFYNDSEPEQEVIRDKVEKIVLSDLELTDIYIHNPMTLSFKDLNTLNLPEKIKKHFSKDLTENDLSIFEMEFTDSVIDYFLSEIKKEANVLNTRDVM